MITINYYICTLLILSPLVLFHNLLRSNNTTFSTIIITNILLLLAHLSLDNKKDKISGFHISPAIIIQSCVQFSIYLYIYFFGNQGAQLYMSAAIPFVFYQICFGLITDNLFSRFFKIPFNFKYYIIPLILSLNLFIRFKSLYWQLLIIFFAIAIKTWATWKRESNGKHIFNPSGIILALVSLLIMFTDLEGQIIGTGIGNLFLKTPGFDVFLMSDAILTLWIPNSFSIFIGTATFFLLANFISINISGTPLIKLFAGGSVLLGMTLLVTDPKTSPRSLIGKYFFGVAYALSIIVAQEILFFFGKHFYYNKILFLPALNVTAPLFDRLFGKIKLPNWEPNTMRIVMLALYLIVAGYSYFEQQRPVYEKTILESGVKWRPRPQKTGSEAKENSPKNKKTTEIPF